MLKKTKSCIASLLFIVSLVSCGTKTTSQVTESKIEPIDIYIKSEPTKINYQIGDTLSLSGLEVNYVYQVNSEVKEDTITDYKIYLSGEEISSSYTFTSSGEYVLSFSYLDLTSDSVTLYCNTNDDTLPKQYTDDSLQLMKSSHTAKVKFTANEGTSSENYTEKGYYSTDEINDSYHIYDAGRKSYNNQHFLPSTGNVPLLIVPISLPGDDTSFTNDELQMIDDCFYGKSSDIAFESLHSYYYKSSYGQLNFTFNMAPTFSVNDHTNYHDISTITSTSDVLSICQSALTWLKEEKGYNYTKYDSDSDGTIDGVWFVYKGKDSQDMPYWPYVSSTSKSGTVDSPVLNIYGWAGIDFLTQDYYDRVTTTDENIGKDAHVLIHETGHMLGLNDYYSYGNTGYSPLGGRDMMDMSLGDHDIYSKIRLGWVTPTIITGNCELNLKSNFYKNQVFLIPYQGKNYQKDDSGKIKFNPFDEYLLVDLYSDEEMNSYDYTPNKATHTEGYGVRLLHIDARGGQVINGSSFSYFRNPDMILDAESNIFFPISNTDDGSRSEAYYTGDYNESAFDEIRLIDKSGTYIGLMSDEKIPDEDSFFKKGDSFILDNYAKQFVKSRFDYNIKKPVVSFEVTDLN